jgi:hypothetical protein
MSQRACCRAALGLVHRHSGDELLKHALRFLGRRRDALVRFARLELWPRQLDVGRARPVRSCSSQSRSFSADTQSSRL